LQQQTLALFSLLIIILSPIAFTEYTCDVIPAHPGFGKLNNVIDTLEKNVEGSLEVRQTPREL